MYTKCDPKSQATTNNLHRVSLLNKMQLSNQNESKPDNKPTAPLNHRSKHKALVNVLQLTNTKKMDP